MEPWNEKWDKSFAADYGEVAKVLSLSTLLRLTDLPILQRLSRSQSVHYWSVFLSNQIDV